VTAVLTVGVILMLAQITVTAAQDASPTPDPFAGITRQRLMAGQLTAAPDHNLVAVRVTFAPGACTPAHTHPGGIAFYVESGQFAWRAISGLPEVTRAVTEGTPGLPMTFGLGEEVALGPGDALFDPDRHGEVLCNAGEEEAVGLAIYLVAADEPLTTVTNEEGTPTP
jgi:hypothetical protein